ncbi:hypothetical protein [Halobacillus salinus]|nr:hypothetical protein [Halobacillus salinus]
MTKRKAQRDAALTNNNTPKQSIPQHDTGKLTKKNQIKQETRDNS